MKAGKNLSAGQKVKSGSSHNPACAIAYDLMNAIDISNARSQREFLMPNSLSRMKNDEQMIHTTQDKCPWGTAKYSHMERGKAENTLYGVDLHSEKLKAMIVLPDDFASRSRPLCECPYTNSSNIAGCGLKYMGVRSGHVASDYDGIDSLSCCFQSGDVLLKLECGLVQSADLTQASCGYA